MILAMALSALGSTLASLVSGVRVTFAMGAGGVLPRLFGRTDARFKTPVLATVIICVVASMGSVAMQRRGGARLLGSVITVRGVTRLSWGQNTLEGVT